MSNKKHILIVSQCFYPEQFRINDICTNLVERGYKVTVVTGIPNYPKGKFYKGYGLFKKRKEVWNGINIIRIPIVSRGNSKLRLILNYYSFTFFGWFWKTFTKLKADKVFIYESSPLTQAKVGVWYAKRRKIPCSIYVMDLWPESVEAVTGIHSNFIINPIKRMAKRIYSGCEKIFITSKGYENSLVEIGVPNDKIEYWPQYAEEFYKPIRLSEISSDSLKLESDGKFNILFTGNIGDAQGLDVLVETACILKEKNVSNVVFSLVGDGRHKDKLLHNIEKNEIKEYFKIYQRIPATMISDISAQSDALFISLAKNDLFSLVLPAKLQSCIACGKPILVSADGELQRVISDANCGFSADAGDANNLALNIQKLMSLSSDELIEFGENALKYFNDNFTKAKLMDQLDDYLMRD